MKTDSFFSLVPKGVKVAAAVIFGVAILIGPLIGAWQGYVDGLHNSHGMAQSAVVSSIGLGLGLLAGVLIAIWLLCVGYVYADARRRAMPAVLWVLIAILIPNLLGFLLYFALRRPLGSPCSTCGQLVAAEHRFCSWCGGQGSSSPSTPGAFMPPGSGIGPNAAV